MMGNVVVQGEAAMSPDTLGMPGAQRSVAFCVHSWVQVSPPHPAARHLPVQSPSHSVFLRTLSTLSMPAPAVHIAGRSAAESGRDGADPVAD
jgi:hypothetical protein